MSAISEVAPGSFDSYEGIRIVIPGLITFTAGLATYKTLAPNQDLGSVDNALVGFVGALVVGLFLYFWDIPARSAAFGENQPTEYLEEQYPHVSPAEILTAYLLTLNTKMPSNTRNRSLYMGSMYRIGVEMILTLGISTVVIFGASVFDRGVPSSSHAERNRMVAGGILVLIFCLGLIINHGYERRTAEKSRETVTRLGRALRADLWRTSTIIYGTGLVLVVLPGAPTLVRNFPSDAQAPTIAGGLGICTAYWIYRYVRGRAFGPDARKRKRFHSATSGFLFAAPIVLTLFCYGGESRSPLGHTTLLVAWTCVASVVLLSIVIRGHERKLHGVYVGQTRWLKENPNAMADVLPPPPGAGDSVGDETGQRGLRASLLRWLCGDARGDSEHPAIPRKTAQIGTQRPGTNRHNR